MCLWLEEAGHSHQLFPTGKEFLMVLARESYDLVILDWMLPDITGDKLLTWIRENVNWQIPVVFATARDSEEDIVRGLTLGADDYIVKPVRRGELLARVQAVARRGHDVPASHQVLHFPPYEVDPVGRTVTNAGQAVEMTQTEFDLTLFLFRNAGRLLSRGHILESVWGKRPGLNTRTVDTHMSRIRGKLGFAPGTGWRLVAVYNHGYRLEPADRADSGGHKP
jgi:DNA-binding response OmpR family regulator